MVQHTVPRKRPIGATTLMTNRQRILLALIGLIVEIFAIILVIVGLYIRLSGPGNPIGSAYIWLGAAITFGGAVLVFWLNSRLKPK